MHNPMAQLLQTQLQQVIRQNPQARQTMQLLQGKSPQQQQQMFFNMCREHSIDPRQFAGQFGIRLE